MGHRRIVDAAALRERLPMDVNAECVRQLNDALLDHVAARLHALPAGWRVAALLNPIQRTVARMDASWTIRPLGPSDPEPNGWAIYGPLACDTERRADAR
jgi:hypothetical protein